MPGFLPGLKQEHEGIISHGAKLLYAYAEASVPRISVVLRKAFGGAYIVMSSKHLGGDVNLAWPAAQIAVMGAEGAVAVLHRRELQECGDSPERREMLYARYRQEYMTVAPAAARGWIDEVIAPATTRTHLIHYLRLLSGAEPELFSRGNIPLLD